LPGIGCGGVVLCLSATGARICHLPDGAGGAGGVFNRFLRLLTYAIAANHRPWADPLLARCDAALGLSAEQLIHWVDARPWLALALKAAYFSIIPQTILAIVYLGWTNRREVLERFLVRFMLCGLVTAVLFYFLPAQGTCASYNVSTPDYYQPILDHLHALRSGARTLITWREAEGLITFPSFHAIWGVLLTAGFYRTRLFIPVALLNAVMIVSTVPVGMHYFTDVLAGLTISLAAIVLVRRV